MDTLKVGVIGAGWMGHVHGRAYRRVPEHYSDLPARPVVAAVADSSDDAGAAFQRAHDVPVHHRDWRDLLADPDIEAVSVTAPNFLHRELGVAVAEAGKHLWIEKPVGLNAADAEAVQDAVRANAVVAAVGFNYRNVPAVARARRLIEQGAIGVPTNARVQLLTDYAAHPGSPLSWRYAVDRGGHGVLGDLASHGVDLLRFLVGDVTTVMARTAVHIPQRPIADAASHYAVLDVDQPGLRFGEVENEDYLAAIIQLSNGAIGICEASRTAVGEQNNYAVEIHGSKGLLRWDFRRPGELQVSTGNQYAGQPTMTVFSEPGDGEYSAFQPGAGIAMGFDDSKVVEAMNFVRAIRGEEAALAGIDDAVASARALDAMVASDRTGEWVKVS